MFQLILIQAVNVDHFKILHTLWFFTLGGRLGLLDKFSNLSFSTNGRANESCKYHENITVNYKSDVAN